MDNTLTRRVFSHPLHILAFGFGAGLSPKAPGTVGTLVAIPIILLLSFFSTTTYLFVTILLTLLGTYAADWSSRDLKVHDHSGIVIDEIVGFMWVMLTVPLTFINLVLAFAFFRLFDIVKPWPINWVDSKVQGGIGIMVDDLLAAVYASICLHIILYFM